MAMTLLFGDRSPEEKLSYRLTPQPQCCLCRERHIQREGMPLPLTFATAAEQALIEDTSLACKDARML